MRLLDERYRLFGVVNPIDLIAVLFVVAIAFTAANLLFGKATPQQVKKESVPVTFAVRIEALRQSYADTSTFKKGDLVSKVNGKPIGELTGWYTMPTPREVDGAATVTPVASPLYEDLVLEVKGTGERTANGLLVGDVMLKNNMSLKIATPTFQGESHVESLTIEGK